MLSGTFVLFIPLHAQCGTRICAAHMGSRFMSSRLLNDYCRSITGRLIQVKYFLEAAGEYAQKLTETLLSPLLIALCGESF